MGEVNWDVNFLTIQRPFQLFILMKEKRKEKEKEKKKKKKKRELSPMENAPRAGGEVCR